MAGLAAAFGSGAMTNSIDEIEDTDLILITGSNTSETHPIIGRMVKRAVERKRAKLIVVDPRKVVMVNFAHVWLRQRPGTDAAWINGLCHVIIKENLWDHEFVASRTEAFEDLRRHIQKYTPEYVEDITGIAADDIRKVARLYANALRAMILYTMGITQHTSGTDNVKALANLAMLCGNIGKEGTGVNPLRGQNNVQGACDMAALPDVLPGHQPITDERVLSTFQQGWSTGVRLSNKPGKTMTEMMSAAFRGDLRALYVMGENPRLSDANAGHVAKALQNLDLLIVQDIFLTETARLADVVLPAASFAEKDGTFTNTDRRVQRVRKGLDPSGNALADWEIICLLARHVCEKIHHNNAAATPTHHPPAMHISCGYWNYTSPEEVFDELAPLSHIYAGISYERIKKSGLQWPCTGRYHPGTPFMHKDVFKRGKGLFHPVDYIPPAEVPDEEYPFYLSTGRLRYHYHTGTMTRRSRGLDYICPEERIQINPEDGRRLDIKDGDLIRVTSRRGSVTGRALLTDRSAPGMVFMTFHFAEVPANVLTNDALDPVSKIPEFKVSAVAVEKVEEGAA